VFDEWFVNSVGFGFGPAVVKTRNAMHHLRGFALVISCDRAVRSQFEPPVFDVAAPGFRERGYMMMVEVCNGTTAAELPVRTAADPADGKLDVC